MRIEGVIAAAVLWAAVAGGAWAQAPENAQQPAKPPVTGTSPAPAAGPPAAPVTGAPAAEGGPAARSVSGSTSETAPAAERSDRCTDTAPMGDPGRGSSWNGWGNGWKNTRFQPRAVGKLSAEDLPKLKLRWAFGYANVAAASAQPSLVGGRLFTVSENGKLYSLNPKTGCTYWVYQAAAGIPTSPVIGPYHNARGRLGWAVYFGDRKANAYAVDADSGKLVWIRKVDDNRSAAITGSLAVYGGHVFVPVQGMEEQGQASSSSNPCCTFRGSLSALEGGTGDVVWKTYTIAPSEGRGTTNGVQAYAPTGASIWSAPAVDVRRQAIYVTTGNGYADSPQPTTNSVISLDLHSGNVKWVRQIIGGDTSPSVCDQRQPGTATCSPTAGPAYDFSAPPVLTKMDGQDVVLVAQNSGIVYALDPDKRGAVLWQRQFAQGSRLGGQWGMAIDGDNAYVGIADLLTPTPGGLAALAVADGRILWKAQPQSPLCGAATGCSASQGGALTAIPGAVISDGMDGGVRAYSTRDGSILWSFDANQEFQTVNGVPAHGGSMSAAGPVVADGMLYVNSGTSGLVGVAGNVLLAFGVE